MANTPQARKRARQNEKRRVLKAGQRSTLRTSIKKFLKSLETGDANASRSLYQQATSNIDRAVSKGLHHKHRAARLKSRLNNRLRTISS
ncbi:MAG: 30S ribosomal protein S20 [Proteobacteria bacterium]|nr:30S ribosomal protein S20 [Pseudomonadota bacterium]